MLCEDSADLVDGGHAGINPFLELQAGLADLEALALEVGGFLVDHVRVVAADRARSDCGPLGVFAGPLDVIALALPAALEVLLVGAVALAVRDGVGFSAFGIGEL